MFLHRLSPDQQRVFIGLAKNFIEVDAIVEVAEAEALQRMQAETGISIASTEPLPPTAENLAVFETPESRAAVMLELVALAYGDGDVHPRENVAIQEVATVFEIPTEKLLQMEGWVVRHRALLREAEHLLAE